MQDKFTPYGLTALPTAIEDRDVNGVYFIRTATGFKIVCIANDANRTPVELDYPEIPAPDLSNLLPYTEADKDIDFNTQNITKGGRETKTNTFFNRNVLTGSGTSNSSFVLLENVASQSTTTSSQGEVDIVITLPIRGVPIWQMEVDILSQRYRTTLNIGAIYTTNAERFVDGIFGKVNDISEVKFGRIGDNTVVIIKRANPSIYRLQVNISKFYYHHDNYADLYNNKANYKVEYIKEEDLVGFTLNGTVLNKDFIRDPYLLDYNNFTNTPTIPTVPTDDIAKGVVAHGWGNHASQGYLKGERIVIPNNVIIPAGEFEAELLDVCPGFDLADFSSWDITIKTIAPGKVTMTSIRDMSELSELKINKFNSGAMCFFLSGHSKAGFTIPAGSIISLNK